jgi:hypothetical protein
MRPVTDKASDRATFIALTSVASVLFASVFALHNIAGVHSGNLAGFHFALHQVFYIAGPLFLALAAYLIAPAFVLKGGRLRGYAFIVAYLAVAAWVYSNFVVLDFGLLDGEIWDFEPLKKYRTVEIAALIGAGFALWLAVVRRPKIVLSFLVLLNIALVGPTAYALVTDPKDASLEARANLDAAFRFSRRQNVLIVLMDAFQSDLFAELVESDAALAEDLRGFAFFPNTAGVARSTSLTMPAIHGGERYSPQHTVREVYDREVREGSFLNALAEAGHEVTLVNAIQRVCPERIELCIDGEELLHGKWPLLVMETAYLLDLSLFRAVPLFAKKRVYNDQFWFLTPNVQLLPVLVGRQDHHIVESNRVLEALAQRGNVAERPVAKFIHLLNTHRPYVLGPDCRVREDDPGGVRAKAAVQARCGLEAFLGLMDFLKRQEIYDESLIFLIADTGANLASRYTATDNGTVNGTDYWRRLVGRANPLFLVKAPGARGPFRQSTAGIQPSDIPATVCAYVAGCDSDSGMSVFDAESLPPRARVYKDYSWPNSYWGKDVIPESQDYTVLGPIWDRDSWVDYDPLRTAPDPLPN